jgi:hypothetical protein
MLLHVMDREVFVHNFRHLFYQFEEQLPLSQLFHSLCIHVLSHLIQIWYQLVGENYSWQILGKMMHHHTVIELHCQRPMSYYLIFFLEEVTSPVQSLLVSSRFPLRVLSSWQIRKLIIQDHRRHLKLFHFTSLTLWK